MGEWTSTFTIGFTLTSFSPLLYNLRFPNQPYCSQDRIRTCIYTLLVLAVSDRLGINTFPSPPALNH